MHQPLIFLQDALLAAANARKHLGVRAVIHTTMGDMCDAVCLFYECVYSKCMVDMGMQLSQIVWGIRA
jgi:hypothetical protein